MKAVFILPGRGRSGGIKTTVIMANKLIDRGHNIRILYQKPPRKIYTLCKAMQKKLFFPNVSDWLDNFTGELKGFNDISSCSFSDKEIVIGVGMWASHQLGRLISIPNPKLQYIKGSTPWEPIIMENALKLPIPKIVVASYLRPLLDSYGDGKVLAVVPNGIDTKEYFNPVCESDRNGVGTIYSSHSAKDPETTISVLNKILRIKPDIPIRVFSTDKKPNQIKRYSYWRLPSIEKAREIYSRSFVWFLASSSEGFPAPILEAMACDCAVVTTNCGGTSDIIKDGENGFLVDVADVEAITERILLLLNNKKLREDFREKGRETVNKFTWDKSVDLFENILETLLLKY